MANPTKSYTSLDEFNVTLIVSNNCGADTIVKTVTITGITDVAGNDLNVSVYPNPTNGSFTYLIDSEMVGEYDLTVTDSYGRIVFQDKINKDEQIFKNTVGLENSSEGIYFVSFVNGSKKHVVRLMIVQND